MRTRIKICGITRPEDARLAADLGADAIGLVFYSKSPRAVTATAARTITTVLPPFVMAVGLFLDAHPEYIREVLATVPLDLLQFHGDECPADCGVYGKPYIKAIPMGGHANPVRYAAAYPQAAGYLLDSHALGQAGGSGQAFAWGRWPSQLSSRLILAGGLTPDNVAIAIGQTRPYAVDVSSGVEADRGVKDSAKMAAFISEVHRVNCNQD